MTGRLCIALTLGCLFVGPARADDTVKIGFIAPSTGQFAQIGAMMIAGAKYFLAANGTSVGGKRIGHSLTIGQLGS